VGTLPTSGSFLLSRAVNELLKQCAEARVRIIEESYEHLLDDLRAGNIDFLFSVLRKPDWATDVSEEELFSDPYVIAVRPGHPLTLKRDVKREDLMKYDWVLPGPSTPRYLAFKRLFTLSEGAPTTHIVTTSRAILRSLLTMSDRITLLTKHEAQFEQGLGILSVIPFASKLPSRRYGVATRADWRPTTVQRQFLNLLSAVSRDVGGHTATKQELDIVTSALG